MFSHNINLEKENDSVAFGRELHEQSYRKNTRNVMIDGTINIDFVKSGKKLEVHEVKKSKKMDEADRAQLLFYLYYLKKKGFDATGVMNYPLLNKVEKFELDPEAEMIIEKDIEDIKKIIVEPMPHPKRMKICSKCAYVEFCFCGDGEEIDS